MPSKYGFGNTRKKSPYKLNRAMYGMDQKNPMVGTMDQENPIMKKETLPGIDAELDAKSPVKKMDPMYDGKPGVQKADFEQFSKK